MAKPPFPWIGGKEKIAPYILQTFPPKLAQYVEPFGGSGAVLLALPQDPSRLDIYNDLDAELVNLYSCIKECSNVLLRELKFLPIHSRRLFEYYLHVVRPETGRWEYAGGILGVRSSMAWIVWDAQLCSAEHNLLNV